MAAACPDRAAEVLDIGCGTGLVAEELAARGFSAIDGLDASPRMLAEARAKGLYRNLVEGDVRARGTIEPGRYDAVIAVGVFGAGHLGPEDLDTLRATGARGRSDRALLERAPLGRGRLPSHLRRLEEAGAWTVERTEETNYMDRIERPGWLVVARRAPGGAGHG